MASAPASCSNPDCAFDERGSCAAGGDPDTCRFRAKRPLILDDSDHPETDSDYTERGGGDDHSPVDADGDDYTGNVLVLGDGERLSVEESRSILAEAPTRVVSIVAPREAGKTSLIARIYEMFLEGRQAGVVFRASRTILGFERLCHLSRAASGRTTADMERTRRAEGLGYFHLDLISSPGRVGLLLGDRPGENFVTAAENLDRARELIEISAAATFVYLIDGRVLVNPATKGLPRSVAVNILDAVVEAELPRARPALAVVLTKADLVHRAGDEAALARFDEIVEHLGRRYATAFGSVKGYRTAASPEILTDGYSRGHGLAALLQDLILDGRATFDTVRATRTPERKFESLGLEGEAAA